MQYIRFLLIILIVLSSGPVLADQVLSDKQLRRIQLSHQRVRESSKRTFKDAVKEIASSPAPEGALQIYEAVSKVYVQLLREYDLQKPDAKFRLLEKIQMNMAYFQLGGPDVENPNEGGLNVIIRRRLKEHLSKELMQDERLFYSLTD